MISRGTLDRVIRLPNRVSYGVAQHFLTL